MKKIFLVMVLTIFWALSNTNAQHQDKIFIGQSKVVDLSYMAQAYFNENTDLGSFIGVDYGSEDFAELLEAALELDNQLGIKGYSVNLPVISTQTVNGIEESTELAISDIGANKFLLFAYTMSNSSGSEQIDNFIVEFGDGTGFTEEEIEFYESFLAENVINYFNSSFSLNEIYKAEAYAIRQLLAYLNDDSEYEFAAIEGEGGIESSVERPDLSGVYLAPTGHLVRLPSNTVDVQYSNKSFEGGWPSIALYSFILNKDDKLVSYRSIVRKDDTSVSGGYGNYYETESGGFEWEIYQYDEPSFTEGGTERARVGFVKDECGSFWVGEVDYQIPENLPDEDRKCQGSKIENGAFAGNMSIEGLPVYFESRVASDELLELYQSMFGGSFFEVERNCASFMTPAMFSVTIDTANLRAGDIVYHDGDHITVFSNVGAFHIQIDNDGSIYTFQYDYQTGRFEPFEVETLPLTLHFYLLLEKAADIHTILGALGLGPGPIGLVADLVDGIVYWVEGDITNASLSFGASIPVIGLEIRGAQWILKNGDTGAEISKLGRVKKGEEEIKESLSEINRIINELGFDQPTATKFGQALSGNRKFQLALTENPELIRAWKAVKDFDISTDVFALGKVSKALENGVPVAKIQDDLGDVVKTGNALLKTKYIETLDDASFIVLRRGTDRTGELIAYDQSGYILSDAARSKYLETGNLEEALTHTDDVHQQWLDIFNGDINAYAQAHALNGTEMESIYGLKRTLVSTTSDKSQVGTFIPNGGEEFIGVFEKNKVIQQTLDTSTESEYLIIGGTEISNILP